MADELRARFAACGQEQVFRFWDQLSEEQRSKLLAEAAVQILTSVILSI
jgi:adenine-specific DNA glycosylase